MSQSNFGFDPIHKRTRKEIFLEEMNRVVPWAALVGIIQPHARGAHQALGGRPPFAVETMLRIHCLQLWWNLSDPAMEEELHERPLYREFAGLAGSPRIPDETTILRFRHLLEKQSPSDGCPLEPSALAPMASNSDQRDDAGLTETLQGKTGHERTALLAGPWLRGVAAAAWPDKAARLQSAYHQPDGHAVTGRSDRPLNVHLSASC